MKKSAWTLAAVFLALNLVSSRSDASGPYAYLVVVAHPDDETAYLSHGILQLGRDQGLKGAILVLSSGEKGGCRGSWEMDQALGARREGEMARAAEVYRMDLLLGGFRDYGEARTPDQVFRDAWDWEHSLELLVQVIRELKPSLLVTQDPDRAPDSPAHRAAARLATEAFKAAADPAYHPELGPAWTTLRHFSSTGDADRGTYRIPGDGHAPFKRAAEQAHDSQGADDWDVSEAIQGFTLQQGTAPEKGNSLSQGLDLARLDPALSASFKPSVRRLYLEKRGMALQRLQARRWDRFLAELPPYRFRFAHPARIERIAQVPAIDGRLEGMQEEQLLTLADPSYPGASATLRLGWHPTGLYLGLQVRKKGAARNKAEGGQYWKGDALELFLNPHPEEAASKRVWRSTRDRQIILAPDSIDGRPKAVGVSVGTFPLIDPRIAARNVDGGYVLEAFIPAQNYTRWGFNPGDKLRFEAALDLLLADGSRRQISWHDLTPDTWFDPDGWGLAEIH